VTRLRSMADMRFGLLTEKGACMLRQVEAGTMQTGEKQISHRQVHVASRVFGNVWDGKLGCKAVIVPSYLSFSKRKSNGNMYCISRVHYRAYI
jgi:hypothetical protein